MRRFDFQQTRTRRRLARMYLLVSIWPCIGCASNLTAPVLSQVEIAESTGGFKHHGWVNTIRFSPDGATLVTASWDATAVLWNIGALNPLAKLTHGARVNSAKFDHLGRRVITASTIRLPCCGMWKPGNVLTRLNMKLG